MPNSRSFKSILSTSSLANSETRIPVENNTSNIVLSRRPPIVEVSGDINNRSICSRSKNLILCSSPFGKSTFSGDKVLIPFLAQYFKNALKAIT